MEKITEFTAGRGRYNWAKIADGGIWQLRRGHDYPGPDRNVAGAARSWAWRHHMLVTCHVPEEGVVEIRFTPRED